MAAELAASFALPLASIADSVTKALGTHGVYAIFLLMLLDAVMPAASELVMVYAGALAAGTFTGQQITLFGSTIDSARTAFLVVALAGTLGYLVGSWLGWLIGYFGGRPLVERYGRWLHLDEARLARADAWFERRGQYAVLFGRVTPVVRSFISVPAGIARMPFGHYTLFTLIGSAAWAFAFAGVGAALGQSWSRFHHGFELLTIMFVLCLIGFGAIAITRAARRADSS